MSEHQHVWETKCVLCDTLSTEERILELQRENAAMLALLERVRNVQIGALSPTTAEDIKAFLEKRKREGER